MVARTLTKIGETKVLRPAAPSFAADQDGGFGLLGLTNFQQSYQQADPMISFQSVYFDFTDKTTGFPDGSQGYLSISPSLTLQGYLWPPGTNLDSGFASGFLKRYDAGTSVVTTGRFDPFDEPDTLRVGFITNVPANTRNVQAIPAPSAVIDYDFSTTEGWADRTGSVYFGTAFGDSGTLGWNVLYDTDDNPGNMSCISIIPSFDGPGAVDVTVHTAFSKLAINYAANFSPNLAQIFTTVAPDNTYWTISLVSPPDPAAATMRLVNWSRLPYGAIPMETVFDGLALSDATDQTDWDTFLATGFPVTLGTNGYNPRVFGNKIIFELGLPDDTDHEFIVVSTDWTTYERVSIRAGTGTDDRPGLGPWGVGSFYIDREGYYYGLRAGVAIYRLYEDGPEPPPALPEPDPDAVENSSPVIRSWGFTLDSHEMYVNRLGSQSTLVFDSKTGQWSRWASNGRPVWRAHQGFNWLGMAADNYLAGATTNVVCGDDASGVLWTLDPDSPTDDIAFDPEVNEIFPRRVITGFPMRARDSQTNGAVFMTADVGSPSSETYGNQIRLETSDDYGKTWQDQGVFTIVDGEFDTEVVWRSLGRVRAPGRLYRFTDFGATTRIDGVDSLITGLE